MVRFLIGFVCLTLAFGCTSLPEESWIERDHGLPDGRVLRVHLRESAVDPRTSDLVFSEVMSPIMSFILEGGDLRKPIYATWFLGQSGKTAILSIAGDISQLEATPDYLGPPLHPVAEVSRTADFLVQLTESALAGLVPLEQTEHDGRAVMRELFAARLSARFMITSVVPSSTRRFQASLTIIEGGRLGRDNGQR